MKSWLWVTWMENIAIFKKPEDMTQKKMKMLNVCSGCIKTLGMLSWSMATIQDHRS